MDSWQIFAEKLFCTEDADPVYYALARADVDPDTKKRMFVGWCTYYHPGVACWAAQYKSSEFWDALSSVYDTAPRASERRHFRGQAGRKALATWRSMYAHPEEMVKSNVADTYFHVRARLKMVAQYGDYFYWKFADVQERVFRLPCDFTGAEKYSPKVPQEGAKLISDKPIEQVYAMIVEQMRPRLAPPWYDRPINMQEAETVCCVYHQYVSGGYTYGSRTAKAYRRLSAYPNPVSDALLDALTLGLPYQPPQGEDE